MLLALPKSFTFPSCSEVKNCVLLWLSNSFCDSSRVLGMDVFFFSSRSSNACPPGTPAASDILTQVTPSLPWPSVKRLSQHRASMENDESCLTKKALILINGSNLSTDSQSAFLLGSGWQLPSPVWGTRWCGLANTTRLRWRDEEGAYRSSISELLSLLVFQAWATSQSWALSG